MVKLLAVTNGNQGIFTVNTAGQPIAGNISFERTWANFLLGRASNFRQDSVDLTAVIQTNQFEFFAQDDFKLRPNRAGGWRANPRALTKHTQL
ncbi:MAG: hypothetical protein LAO76_07100 [Acidobacteriia bacterium]|nr:hypothetical protein [Terriglobia bacterium]